MISVPVISLGMRSGVNCILLNPASTVLANVVIANVFAQPLSDKLARASQLERTNKSLIMETISGIQEGMNPRVLEQLLSTYLPANKRAKEDEGEGE